MTAARQSADVIAQLLATLQPMLGGRISTEMADRDEHAGDVSHHPRQPPDLVAYPVSNQEVSAITQACATYRVPIIPFGTGTAVEGGVVASHGGLCIDLRRMNQILRVGPEDMDATVQAGVTRKQLNRHLDELDGRLYFPVDPGADASLGGMAATRASGSAAVRYGTMRENVLALTVVLADGRIIHTGSRARKSSAGYDLTHLMVGSEGTLGIITEVTVKLTRKPAAVSAAVCPFPSIDAAVAAVIEVLSDGVPLARIELLDEIQMAAVNHYSSLDYQVAPTLFFEFHGTAAGVVEQAETVGHIVERHGGAGFQWATEQEQRDRLWQARHDAYYASLALRPGTPAGYVTDVCVPISGLAECIRRAKQETATTRVPAPLFGHVGDGNFHIVFPVDHNNAEELSEVRQISSRIVQHALELGGTCTGEHGIGLGKIDDLVQEHGEGVAVMRSIKQALDPLNILNPGKVLHM